MLKSLQSTLAGSSTSLTHHPVTKQPYLLSLPAQSLPILVSPLTLKRPDPDKTEMNSDADYLCDYITEILRLFWFGNLDIKAWHTGA
eukprot:10167840-Ditylum_brightwellii.AAC.1